MKLVQKKNLALVCFKLNEGMYKCKVQTEVTLFPNNNEFSQINPISEEAKNSLYTEMSIIIDKATCAYIN